MNAGTTSIIISVIMVGVVGGALTMAGFKQLRTDMDRRFGETREDIRELRQDVKHLHETFGALNERVRTKAG